ncbi:Orn/Lys/Arg decarboxylase N-terminal domain-containing protein [Pseudomonas typographi]|uniref:Arginine decarboxylase n=1 Tax=Pseudomonas typographi TaxID=2715964 RepID=A0ABR7Z0T1_9PSED|nr:Orn/Lys/Arg decarboxylase N-terminal domain-containing protein [Pseudomonas typographi]MBD1552281.1 arginine decarboxylase [Pseudomonas typographi]MBD1587401.1 arginine decarboxylase [Pseudomonas typographi]MBD1599104.1 arginine decarboxylase [Pseudomonas typographi]
MSDDKRNLGMLALLVSAAPDKRTVFGRALGQLIAGVEERDISVLLSESLSDATAILKSDPAIQCLLLNWGLDDSEGQQHCIGLLKNLRERNTRVPVFLISDRSTANNVPLVVMQHADDFIWLPEDTPAFLSGRILAAIERYRQAVLPPMFSALLKFSREYEYSWHTPGHAGGTAFLKSTAGRAFYEYFGENLLRSDLSISVSELGSLLDHSGPIGQGERYAAKVFGAHRTYYVTNGSSTSNRVILMASVTRNQVALCDRNCHKSAEHAMTLSGAIPTYLLPTRNRYGIIGPILPQTLAAPAVAAAIAANPLVGDGVDPAPRHAIITNSTYDGLCYHVGRVEQLLGQSVDRLHFDEAWYGYARFNPLYRDRFAMHGDPAEHDDTKPTVFATQSTHKLLAALSQASMIHVRNGRNAIDHGRFNESFMMHASTSPNYAIMASCDVSSAMMEAPNGQILTNESIEEAISFRQVISRMHADLAAEGQWFFSCWQPPTVQVEGETTAFHDADPQALKSDPAHWLLGPGEAWHGFGDIEAGYCLLDPIKVSILTPGVGHSGELGPFGIPACVVSAYLSEVGIVVEKTTDFTLLFLFSIGITKGKWGTLVNALLDFKRDYDENLHLELCLPDLVRGHQARYGQMGLRELCEAIFAAMKAERTTATMARAFSQLPEARLSPAQAYEQLVRGEVELLPLDQAAGRTVATGVVPYPPGIPLLMPGEHLGPTQGPYLSYLRALERFDQLFPGFGHDTHGVEVQAGAYRVLCLK